VRSAGTEDAATGGTATWTDPVWRAAAVAWRRILRGVHPWERAEWADSVPGWTAEHLEPGTLTAAPVRG
jgi:hypothetical protein